MEDWPLHAYLWAGAIPDNEEERDQILHAEKYRANQDKLQVFFPKIEKLTHMGEKIEFLPDCWINVTPIANRKQILMDAHVSLGHCGRDKLIISVQKSYWWPGLGRDAMDCICCCLTCQRDSPPKPLEEELHFVDKGIAPLLGWVLDSAGSFKEDDEGKRCLLIAIDPFSKWVEIKPVPLLHSWRTTEFLYDSCSH